MMHMTFYWGKTVTILFDKWKTDTWLGYALSLLALLLVAAFLQYLEDHRIRLKILASSNISPSQPSFKVPFLSFPPSAAAARLASAALFGVNSALGYLLMLAVMSFNAGVLIAVVVGLAAGYFLFRSELGQEDLLALETSCACA